MTLIITDTTTPTALEFMRRSEGDWISNRRYIYNANRKVSRMVNYETHFTVSYQGDDCWRNEWVSYVDGTEDPSSQGVMNMHVHDGLVSRDRAYMSDTPDQQLIQVIDKDCLVFRSAYGGMSFREEIRLCENDNVRLRQTYGKKDESDEIFLVGQYYEKRKLNSNTTIGGQNVVKDSDPI